MPSPLVLLVHGVSSTGEWHDTTIQECHGLFQCLPIKYRYYHGLTGAVKVYAWPTALLSILAVAGLLSFDNMATRLAVVGGILFLATVVVVHAEYEWSGKDRRVFLLLLYPLLAVACALFLEGNARLALLLATIPGLSVYLDLREYGHPNVSVDQACLASLLVLGAAAWGARWLLEQTSASAGWVVLAVLTMLAIVEPWIRRRFAFRFVRRKMQEARRLDPFPHVVAHSLGTYLTGHLVNEEERLFLGRVIFTGCVLDRGFPWHENVGPGTVQKCWAVKNYVGGRDAVPVLTGLLRVLWVSVTSPVRVGGIVKGTEFLGNWLRWRPLGWAGQRGFRDREAIVHSQAADVICATCVPGDMAASVHNVGARFAGHSSLNQDPDYQCFQWLPFLWADSPDKFDYWKEICRIGNQAIMALEALDPEAVTPTSIENQNVLADAEQKLLQGPWYWPLNTNRLNRTSFGPGRPLRDYVAEVVNGFRIRPVTTVDVILRRLPRLVFEKFAAALAERKEKAPRPEVVALLEPRKVLIAAICDAINLAP